MDSAKNSAPALKPVRHDPASDGKGYGFALIVCAAATAIGLPFRASFDPENAAMLYLVGIALAATYYGRASSTLAAIVSAGAYNFFFTQPYYSFWIDSTRDIVATVLLLVTSVIIGSLAARLRAQNHFLQYKEQATAALYAMTRELASARNQDNMIIQIRHHAENMFDGTATLWLPLDTEIHCITHPELTDDLKEKSAAQFSYENAQSSGLETSTLAGARGFYLPLKGSAEALGVLGFMPRAATLRPDERDQLEAIASVAASALERVSVAELAEKRKVEAEGEKMRNALLSSVSHDLRTPLASIKGAISSMMIDDTLSSDAWMELLVSAHNETTRLERIVTNLLDVTLLESGRLQLKKDFYFMSELVGNALQHTKELLKEHPVECAFDEQMPALWVDGVLIEQVLVNLLENAAKYSPPDSPILIDAWVEEDSIRVIVADRGPGVNSGEEQKLFDKFYRGTRAGQGSGLGLTICRGIVEAHGGKITARKREGGGTVFSFLLPDGHAPDTMNEAAA